MRFFSISVILNIFWNWVRVLNIFRNWARVLNIFWNWARVLNIFQNWASVLNIFRNWVRVLNIFQNWVRPKKSRRRPQIAKRWLLASGPSAPIFHEESESEIRYQKFQPVPEIWPISPAVYAFKAREKLRFCQVFSAFLPFLSPTMLLDWTKQLIFNCISKKSWVKIFKKIRFFPF